MNTEQEPQRCGACDGTGDVHRSDGEYLGVCPYCKQEPQAQAEPEEIQRLEAHCIAYREAIAKKDAALDAALEALEKADDFIARMEGNDRGGHDWLNAAIAKAKEARG